MRKDSEIDFLMKTWGDTFRLKISPLALSRIKKECEIANSFETGGILLGYYADFNKLAVVTDISGAPTDSLRGNSWFRRGKKGLRRLLEEKWKEEQRVHYLGEWHFHPTNNIQPSSDDLSAMTDISISPDHCCKEPIMIIAGRTTGSHKNLRAYVFPAGRSFEEFFEVKQ